MSLTDFLRARIAEDEDVAVTKVRGVEIRTYPTPRVLAESEAKRQILERADKVSSIPGGEFYADVSAADRTLTAVLLVLAGVYADHPDYRDEWKL